MSRCRRRVRVRHLEHGVCCEDSVYRDQVDEVAVQIAVYECPRALLISIDLAFGGLTRTGKPTTVTVINFSLIFCIWFCRLSLPPNGIFLLRARPLSRSRFGKELHDLTTLWVFLKPKTPPLSTILTPMLALIRIYYSRVLFKTPICWNRLLR